jgi:hypothetical protein
MYSDHDSSNNIGIDTNIENYTIQDMFSILDIENPTSDEIITKTNTFILKFKKEKKLDMVFFFENMKSNLMEYIVNNESLHTNYLEYGSTNDNLLQPNEVNTQENIRNIIKHPNEPFINVDNTNIYSGKINQLNNRFITQYVNIDSRFRPNYFNTSSTNFTLQLPTTLTNVVSMGLSSSELPFTFYTITSSIGNDFMFIEVSHYTDATKTTITTSELLIYIETGNYSASDLTLYINTILCPVSAIDGTYDNPTSIFSYILFKIDISGSSGTGRTIVQPNPVSKVTNTAQYNKIGTYPDMSSYITEIKLNFARDINGYCLYSTEDLISNNISEKSFIVFTKSLAWCLGFRNIYYYGNSTHTSETVIDPTVARYIYLGVNDFNNSVSNLFVNSTNLVTVDSNILARIPLKGNTFSVLMENDFNMVTEPRKYFGPVNIDRLQITLYDDNCNIITSNKFDFSICLSFKMVYDL